MPGKPHIDCEQHHAILAVGDVRATADFYADKLGFTVAFIEGTPPTFAGINLGKIQIFLEKGTPAPRSCSVYFVISDADAFYEFHRANGVEIVKELRNQTYGFREYTVQDYNGYYLNFGHRVSGSGCGKWRA